MKHLIAEHSCSAFLKPGEVIISSGSLLVSTVLGSCVAVTMHAQNKGIGAICHAMLPSNPKQNNDLHYVDMSIRYIHRKLVEMSGDTQLVIKLFGGAQVLAGGTYAESRLSVGEQNLKQARATLAQLGLSVANADIGGTLGRKLFFSIKTGDVYLRKLKLRATDCNQGVRP